MGNSNKNKPKIRFSGFLEDWEENTLKNNVMFNPKAELPDIFEYVDLESVSGTELISHRQEYKQSAPSRAQRLANKGDVFYQTVRPYQKNNYLFEKSESNFVFSTGYAQMRPNGNSYFLLSLVQGDEFVKIVLDNCTGTSYPAINSTTLASIKSFFPQETEQQKIGSYFQNIDQLINLQQQKQEKLLILKKAMLSKMFPKEGASVPEIRFKGFTEVWEEKSLGEIGEIVTGSTPSTQEKSYYSKTGTPWVTPTDICKNITYSTFRFLSEKGEKVARIVPSNTILVTCIASIGKNTILGTKGSFNQQINGLIPNENKYSTYFLFTLSALWSYKMKQTASSGIMQIVNKDEFSKLITKVPNLIEQKQIGSYFQNLDQLINQHKEKLAKLKQLKKSCLTQMFV